MPHGARPPPGRGHRLGAGRTDAVVPTGRAPRPVARGRLLGVPGLLQLVWTDGLSAKLGTESAFNEHAPEGYRRHILRRGRRWERGGAQGGGPPRGQVQQQQRGPFGYRATTPSLNGSIPSSSGGSTNVMSSPFGTTGLSDGQPQVLHLAGRRELEEDPVDDAATRRHARQRTAGT